MFDIDPLQDATETLRTAYHGLSHSLVRQLQAEVPEFLGAVHAVLAHAAVVHIDPPVLSGDERQPEDVPASGIFDTIFDERAPRHLKDVWGGAGDFDDPLVPADDHEHDLVLARLRAASDEATPLPRAVVIGTDGIPTTRTDAAGHVVRGPEYDVDWLARDKGVDAPPSSG